MARDEDNPEERFELLAILGAFCTLVSGELGGGKPRRLGERRRRPPKATSRRARAPNYPSSSSPQSDADARALVRS